MTLHCDVAVSPRWWRLYFTAVIESLREMMKDFRDVGLLASHGELEVWKEHYLQELGGQRVLHAPLGASIDDFLEAIARVFLEKLNVENVPISVRKTVAVYLRLEGALNLQLPEGVVHEVPFDVTMTHRSRKRHHGDIYLRTFTYLGYEFIDFFQGGGDHAVKNRDLLVEALKRFSSRVPHVHRIIVGSDIDAYEDLTRVMLYFSHREERLFEELLETARTLKRDMKEGRPLPEPLTSSDLEVISDRTRPMNKNYLQRLITKHPFYKVDVPQYYREHDVIRQEGSILIYQKNFKPMTDVHAFILKDIATALQRSLRPRQEFDKLIIETLNEIHERKRQLHDHSEIVEDQQHVSSREEKKMEEKESNSRLNRKMKNRPDILTRWIEKTVD